LLHQCNVVVESGYNSSKNLVKFVQIAAVNIFLTLDYELFFGTTSGSAEQCILNPTQKLMEITERTGARMTYFIDAGYLVMLKKLAPKFPELQDDYARVSGQIKELVSQGNDCQLHVHPHWEDAHYENGHWVFPVDRYKLIDFEKKEAEEIFLRYANHLQEITGQQIHSYRAGGWCLQPFSHVKEAFSKVGIQFDSTVFPGGFNENEVYSYDFRSIESNEAYRFEDDLCVTEALGSFMELPIAAHTYHPIFFWQLYGWGRLIPTRHKPLGNGFPISTSGERSKRLTKKSRLPVSLDGYFAKSLSGALRKNKSQDFVVIGHPKACTLYSLEQLEKFILRHKGEHSFMTFSDRLKSTD